MTAARWWERAREVSLGSVAAALGLTADKSGSAMRPCPVCGADARGKSSGDRRGPVGIYKGADGRGRWRCYRCDAGGDSIALASAVVCRSAATKGLTPDQQRDLWDWFTGQGWAPARDGYAKPPVARPVPVAATPEPENKPPPPSAEVDELWERCGIVADDPEAAAYLASRKIDPVRVSDLDAARALPVSGALPSWAGAAGRTWRETGNRIIVPLWDVNARMVSMVARNISRDCNGKVKSLAARGRRRGAIMACGLARQILAKGIEPDWWPSSEPFRIVISEGEIDWLLWMAKFSDANETAPARFGIVQGSWSAEIAARIPDKSTVIIRTDNDDVGDKYAARIVETFRGRGVELKRGGVR